MDGYAFKYYGKMLKGIFRSIKPWHIIITTAVWAFVAGRWFDSLGIWRFAAGAVCGIVFIVIWNLIGALILTVKNVRVYGVLDRFGYGTEYLRAYEKERIIGKPFNLKYAAEYAEIFSRMGQSADAIKYLNTITVPDGAGYTEKIMYFYVYVTAALKINNLAIAEDMWQRNQDMINRAKSDPLFSANSYILYLALIYIDCYAARQNGDVSRLQRAYEQTRAYMSTAYYKRYPIKSPDFEIILLYELKALGRTEEFNALLPKVKQKINSYEPTVSVEKDAASADLNKVLNGEMPL